MNFTEDQLDVLCALLNGGCDFLSLSHLAEKVSAGYEQVQDTLLGLDVEGFIEFWEREEGLAFTLSPLGAERLDMRLVEVDDDRSMWILRGDPDPPLPRAKGVMRQDVTLDFFEDVTPQTKAPAWVGKRLFDPTGLPYPTIFLTKNGHTPHQGGTCDSCGGEPLQEYMYCLKCDRWGLDGMYVKGAVIKDLSPEEADRQKKQLTKKNKEKYKAKSLEAKEKFKAKLARKKAEANRLKRGEKRVTRKVA
jgi:hypothetical protein